ncbi:hypothetical protein K438DRAFT_1962002 [Mycena galopus ATCC 62051]|nr:hypothetical protein K438DRAFT_1962002 [Mycena galopus ATCC 62051]
MSSYSPPTQTLNNTLGTVLLSLVVSCVLFGISTLQVWAYSGIFPPIQSWHSLSTLDTTHLCLSIASLYYYGVVIIWPVKVTSTPSICVLMSTPIVQLQVALNIIVIFVVQGLYVYRVWLLSGFHLGVLGYVVAGVVLNGFAIGIGTSYEIFTINNRSEAGRIAWAIEWSYAATTMIDIIIVMVYYPRKSQTKQSLLNSHLSTMIQFSLSSGIFTSAVLCLFTFILMPNTLIFFALGYILTRLYANSFLVMMNSRERAPRHHDSAFVVWNNTSNGGFVPWAPRPDPESLRGPHYSAGVDVPMPAASRSSSGTSVPSLNEATLYSGRKSTPSYTRER